MPKKILMIVGDFSESLEVYGPLFTLKALGFDIDIACPNKPKGDTCTTAVHDCCPLYQTYTEKPGYAVMMTVTMNDVNPKMYDALYLPGGRAPEYLRTMPKVVECVKYFMETGKPIAAMCQGTQIMFATGTCQGRKMTCYPTMMPECIMA